MLSRVCRGLCRIVSAASGLIARLLRLRQPDSVEIVVGLAGDGRTDGAEAGEHRGLAQECHEHVLLHAAGVGAEGEQPIARICQFTRSAVQIRRIRHRGQRARSCWSWRNRSPDSSRPRRDQNPSRPPSPTEDRAGRWIAPVAMATASSFVTASLLSPHRESQRAAHVRSRREPGDAKPKRSLRTNPSPTK
jgi:hypothetical protein